MSITPIHSSAQVCTQGDDPGPSPPLRNLKHTSELHFCSVRSKVSFCYVGNRGSLQHGSELLIRKVGISHPMLAAIQ